MILIDIFKKIIAPKLGVNYLFTALPITGYDEHRIAKDTNGNPVLLLSINSSSDRPDLRNIKLQNVSVLFDIKCTIQQEEKLVERNFSAILFTGIDSSLQRYFLRLCSDLIEELGVAPTREHLRIEITKFIEIFRFASQPQKKEIQGLWAELFFILQSKNPAVLIKYWHAIPEEKFDFNSGSERIEIKSSITSSRNHNFSLEQLISPYDTKTVVVSILVRQISSGVNITTLIKEICKKLDNNIELIEKLHYLVASTLGNMISDSDKVHFDFQFAKDSIRIFRAEDVPHISIENIPKFVSEVRFKSDLASIDSIEIKDFKDIGILLESI